MNQRDRRRLEATAYHEAGHAVMRLELGRRPVRATIKPRADSLGHVLQRPTRIQNFEWHDDNDWRVRRWYETEIMYALAGPEAERRFTGRRNNRGASKDDERAWRVALQSEGYEGDEGERARAFLKWLGLKTRDWLASRLVWLQIEAVVAALLERQTLSGAEVRQVRMAAVLAAVPGIAGEGHQSPEEGSAS